MAVRFRPTVALILFATSFLAQSTTSSLVMVKLDKQHVPVMSGDRQVAVKTAYYGSLFVGYPKPQEFSVVFDTGSGHLFLPSAACTDEACDLHRRYDKRLSRTSTQVYFDGSEVRKDVHPDGFDQVSVAYGTGEIVGDFVRENVCIGVSAVDALSGGEALDTAAAASKSEAGNDKNTKKKWPANCARVRVITARQMASQPFSQFAFDGVLGLGLKGLALDPEFHFIGQLSGRKKLAPVFSVFLSNRDSVQSEIAFGGVDEKRMLDGPESLKFAPVANPEQGYWRVRIRSVRVGNETVDMCNDGACTAIVDTGTSLLGVPSEIADTLLMMTHRKLVEDVSGNTEETDCRYVPGPPLIFDMGDFEITLSAREYSRPGASNETGFDALDPSINTTICRAQILPVDMPPLGKLVFIWGEPILSKYYTSYDVVGERVGFARALHPSEDIEPLEVHAPNDTPLEI